jgi:hypothetical protein
MTNDASFGQNGLNLTKVFIPIRPISESVTHIEKRHFIGVNGWRIDHGHLWR